ncbi:MAG: hypothetical protein ABUT20_33295, partial [Bacteroidota bacterium]
MKKFTTFVCLLFSVGATAQYTSQEIKKFKISKIIKQSYNTDSSESQKTETLYDRHGNDTATFMDGQLYKHSIYEYDGKGRALKSINSKPDGSEMETATYAYKPDGSYVITNKDKTYGLTDYTYYDKTGKIIKTKSPDGAERMHTYDAKGHLMKIKTKPGGNGILTDIQYTYNARGQCIKEVSNGEFKWTTTYTYDNKGLIIQAVSANPDDGTKSTYSYEYEF